MNKLKFILASIAALLALTTVSAFADPSVSGAVAGGANSLAAGGGSDAIISDIFTKTCSVENASFLRFMFAMYGNVICTQTGYATILTRVIGFTNVIAMAFMIVLSVWFFITGLMRTATEGEVLGKSWSTVWMPIRISAAITFIMPSSLMGGYLSVAQAFIFQLILSGSMCANILWNGAIDALVNQSHATHEKFYAGQPDEVAGEFKILACMEAMKAKDEQPQITVAYLTDNGSTGSASASNSSYTNTIPYNGASTFTSLMGHSKNIKYIKFDSDCGEHSFAWNKRSFTKMKYSHGPLDTHQLIDNAISSKAALISNAVLHNYEMLEPLAKKIVADEGNGGFGNSENYLDQRGAFKAKKATSPSFPPLFNEYYKDLDAAVESVLSSTVVNPSVALQKWGENAKKRGWIYAGQIYTDIPALQNMSQLIASSTIGNINLPTIQDCNPDKESYWDKLTKSVSCSDTHETYSKFRISPLFLNDAYKNMTNDKYHDYLTPTDSKPQNPDDFGIGFLNGVLRSISPGTTSENIYGTNGSGSSRVLDMGSGTKLMVQTQDPITLSKSVGNKLELAYYGVRITEMAIAVASDLSNALPFVKTTNTTNFIIASLNEVATLCKYGAFMFGYYIPLLPVMTWVSAIFVVFKITTQALVAFPLAVIQMCNPEGEGISGTRMERSWALLAAVFLRPSLTVIALFCSVTLSIVTFSFFQSIFWGSANPFGTPLSMMAILGAYFMSIASIAKQSVWIINEMPEVVLNWFSSGVGGAFGSHAQEITGAGAYMGDKTIMHNANYGANNLNPKKENHVEVQEGKPGRED